MLVNLLAGILTDVLARTGTLGVFFLMLLESACIPVPSEVVLPFAGIMVRDGTITFAAAVAAGTLGQLTGSLLAYAAGRYGGYPLVLKYGKYILIRKHEIEKAERWFQQYGEVTCFAARLVPGVRTFISLPAGVARMPAWRFTAYSLLGVLPWTAFLTWVGIKVGRVWLDPTWEPVFKWAEIVVIAALAVLLIRFIAMRMRENARR